MVGSPRREQCNSMVADDCWRPVQHGKQLVKGCAAAMPCPASGRHTREASLACKMHTYDRTHRTHSRIDKWGHHPTKVSNGWFAACLLQSLSMASCCSAPWWLDVRAVCLCVGCLPASCSSPGWGSRCMLGRCPATGTAFAGAVLYCVSFGHTVTTSLGGKCYDWFLWNADVGM